MTGRAPTAGLPLDGVLVVDKPAGPTSHDIVARVRALTGARRVGHTGTLDPFATGVLPLVLGRGSRLARFLSGATKVYRAEVRFGITTDTYDVTGAVVTRAADGSGWPAPVAIESALERFRGRFSQTPPAFSAKKRDGVRAYERARQAQPVTLDPVPVEVFELRLELAAGDRIVLDVACSAGFYVRALAHDLGQVLGCGAHLVSLRRTRSGEFGEQDAVPVAELERGDRDIAAAMWPLERLLGWMPAAWVNQAAVGPVTHGRALSAADIDRWSAPGPSAGDRGAPGPSAGDQGAPAATGTASDRDHVRVFGPGGDLLAIARRAPVGQGDAAVLQPFVVLV